MASSLQAVCLIEKDHSGEVLWVWSYPTISPGLRDMLMRKCTLEGDGEGEGREEDEGKAGRGQGLAFCFGHYSELWYYLTNFKVASSPQLPKVTSFCVIVLAKEFNPEKYRHLSGIFGQTYISSGSPVAIVSHYLSVFTRRQVTNPPAGTETFDEQAYDVRKAYVACPFKDLVEQFGIESILIYTALLLKKRVVVYAPGLDTVMRVCRTLPLFVWHRQNWNVVYPYVDLDETELEDLSSRGTYVAGFTDAAVEGRTELYDLFVNDAFGMTKLHKDIAVKLMECVQDEEYTDQATIKELSVSTKGLLNNLKTLAPDGEKISLDVLHARKLTPATETFLFSLASAEGIAEL